MDRPKLEVATSSAATAKPIVNSMMVALNGPATRHDRDRVCRTAALGGHLERCDCCNYERPCYDSCGIVIAPNANHSRVPSGREANGRVLSHTISISSFHPRTNRFHRLPEQSGRLRILFRATAETLHHRCRS